jgi:hypothetical protein
LCNARPLGKVFLSPTALGPEVLHDYGSLGRALLILPVELIESG